MPDPLPALASAPGGLAPLAGAWTLDSQQHLMGQKVVRGEYEPYAPRLMLDPLDGRPSLALAATDELESPLYGPGLAETAPIINLQVWRQRDPAACWWYLLGLPDGPQRDKEILNFATQYSFNEPRRALDLVLQRYPWIRSDSLRDKVLDEVVWNWGAQAPWPALGWAMAVWEPQRARLVRRAVLGAATKSKETGAAMALAVLDPQLRVALVNEVHQVWSNYDVPAAITAFLKLPLNLRQGRTVEHFGSATEKLEVPVILSLAVPLDSTAGYRNVFLLHAANRKTFSGRYAEALALVASMPPCALRQEGVHRLALAWGRVNEVQAGAWADKLPAAADREKALDGLAWSLLPSQPERALGWAEHLVAPGDRAALRINLYSAWARKNAVAARAWLDGNAHLNAEEKQACLAQGRLEILEF